MKCPVSGQKCSQECGFWDQCENKLSVSEILKLEIQIGEKMYTGKKFMENLNNPNFLLQDIKEGGEQK